MTSRARWRVSLALGLLIASCARDRLTAPDSSIGAGGPAASSGEDLVAIQRFTIDLSASGTFVPGDPIRIRATIVGNLPTADAEVQVVLPEVEGFQGGLLPVGVSFPSALNEHLTLSAGARRDFAVTVTIPTPGYYRIAVSARKRSAESVVQDGRWTQDVAYAEVWVLIDEKRGRVTPEFDPTSMSNDVIPIAGPRRLKSGGAPGGGPASPPTANAVMAGCDLYHVLYWNPDANGGAGAYETVTAGRVDYEETEDQTGQVIGSGSFALDETGVMQFCESPGISYDGTITLNASYGEVRPVAGTFGGGYSDQDNEYDLITRSDLSRVFANLAATTTASQSLLGYSRAPLVVNVSSTATNSFYDPNIDQVTIQTSSVWGEWGIFTLAHEYGHAVHEKALGGNTGGNCPSPHYITGAYNLQCAFSEGFADFHGVYTRGDVLDTGFVTDRLVEQNAFYSSGDGSIIEGAVAAFFYDLVDGPTDPNGPGNSADGEDANDAAQYPGHYLADIIRTCSVTYPLTPHTRRANGVDDLVYCLERQVDPAVTGSSVYFATRSSGLEAYAETESATEPPAWSLSTIRTLWTHNLYGQ